MKHLSSVGYLTKGTLPIVEKWKTIASEFYKKWNFPNCIGYIDENTFELNFLNKQDPSTSKYKRYFSIVLQGLADENYKFIAVEVSAYEIKATIVEFFQIQIFINY